jgi:hypothetical protein
MSARQIADLFAFAIHRHSEQYIVQFNKMYALMEGKQQCSIMEFRQHKLIDRLFMAATSLPTWRSQFTFAVLTHECAVYRNLYHDVAESKSWRGMI